MIGRNDLTITLTPGGNASLPTTVLSVSVNTGQKADISSFRLYADGKTKDDPDFIFYGQKSNDDNTVNLVNEGLQTVFNVDLLRLKADVQRIAFTATVDEGTIVNLGTVSISVAQGADVLVKADVPMDGRTEAALILGEIYRRNSEWKFRFISQGFNGGLAPLAEHFGVDIDDSSQETSPVPSSAEQSSAIKLEKMILEKAPQLIDLTKPAIISLEKNNLTDVKARVAFVLDCSGSMSGQFSGGNVQAVLERIALLAVQFDDDMALDIWAFASEHKKCVDVTLDNLDGYIKRLISSGKDSFFASFSAIVKGLGLANNEPPVMREVVEYYKDSDLPAYVLFITDGGIHKDTEIEQIVRYSADKPLFWQFVGLGGSGYGLLERLDNLTGRVCDNANFFPIDDFNSIDDHELYDRLLNEFPIWLREAKSKGVLNN